MLTDAKQFCQVIRTKILQKIVVKLAKGRFCKIFLQKTCMEDSTLKIEKLGVSG